MKRHIIYPILISILLLVLLVGAGLAQEGDGDSDAGDVTVARILQPTGVTAALGTAFTFQGQLVAGGAPANGDYDFTFALYDASTGGSQVGSTVTLNDVSIRDGLFTVQLDFGSGIFRGDALYLQLAVRPGASTGPYVSLSPRQPLTLTPYAAYSQAAPWSGLAGVPAGFADGIDHNTTYSAGPGLTLSGTQFRADLTYLQRRVTGTCAAGSSIRVVNADGTVTCESDSNTTYAAGTGLYLDHGTFNLLAAYSLPQGCRSGEVAKYNALGSTWSCAVDNSGTGGSYWSLTGNLGTDPTTDYVGTSDAVTLTLAVNGITALRLVPTSSTPTLIGGPTSNTMEAGVIGSVIGGGAANHLGGSAGVIGGGSTNTATGDAATVGGGQLNEAFANYATIAGGGSFTTGQGNRVTDRWGTVGGGADNQAGDNAGTTSDAAYATVSGGYSNSATGDNAFVGGGLSNLASGDYAAIAGGQDNVASSVDAVIGGGRYNEASEFYAVVAGGYDNTASEAYSAVAGGYTNTASGEYSAVAGGDTNTAGGEHAVVVGGDSNSASADNTFVGGGYSNLASGDHAVVAGGYNNETSGFAAAIGGGYDNTAGHNYTAVAGGYNNDASGVYAAIGGGLDNTASDSYAAIGGGNNNTASALYATVSGGTGNNATANYASAGGGFGNNATHVMATVGGGGNNVAAAEYATIGGGGGAAAADGNAVTDHFGTIGGGRLNEAGDNNTDLTSAQYATVAGGRNNAASGSYNTISGGYDNTTTGLYATAGGGHSNNAAGEGATVGGGDGNSASQDRAMVGGGFDNTASGLSATVAGGESNDATNSYTSVGGGYDNTAGGLYATIPGGRDNAAAGSYSFAAGRRAHANSNGCFVWGDSSNADITCSVTNRFMARASGGVYFYTNSSHTSGSYLAAGGGSWNSVSDRNRKENLTAVDTSALLEAVTEIDISTWNYIDQDEDIRHIGPMAQDFNALLPELGGEGERYINSLDADGVALGAIQALAEENTSLRQNLADVEVRLAALETPQPQSPQAAMGWLFWVVLLLGGVGGALLIRIQRLTQSLRGGRS